MLAMPGWLADRGGYHQVSVAPSALGCHVACQGSHIHMQVRWLQQDKIISVLTDFQIDNSHNFTW